MDNGFGALRKQVRSYQGLDGSWDLTLGLIMMVGGFLIQIGQSRLMGLAIIGIHLAIGFIRSRVSEPRLGYFRLTQTQKRVEAVLGIGITLTSIVAYVVGMIAGKRFFPDQVFLILGVLSSVAVLVIGNLYGLRRFYLYALLVLGGFTAMHFYRTWMSMALFVCGLAVTFTGIAILCRFVRLYPARNGEDFDE